MAESVKLSVMFEDIQQCACSTKSGCEAALHAMRDFFEGEETERLLCVDASN